MTQQFEDHRAEDLAKMRCEILLALMKMLGELEEKEVILLLEDFEETKAIPQAVHHAAFDIMGIVMKIGKELVYGLGESTSVVSISTDAASI
jgi:hypothetical protein